MGSMGGGVPTVDDRTAAEQAANAFAPDDVDSATSVAQMKQSLRQFWAQQQDEMERLEVGSEQDFKNHNDLPLARIKRIMKSDEDVRMISYDYCCLRDQQGSDAATLLVPSPSRAAMNMTQHPPPPEDSLDAACHTPSI